MDQLDLLSRAELTARGADRKQLDARMDEIRSRIQSALRRVAWQPDRLLRELSIRTTMEDLTQPFGKVIQILVDEIERSTR